MTLFVGLGNPGTIYENNRHNIGFHVIDKLVSHYGSDDVSKNAFHGKLYKSKQLLFLKPTTYMNLSGKSLQAVVNFYKIECDDIIVIHDDIDLPFGALRFKKGGGHGGHNGLKSIDATIGKEYLRVRMGVGKPEHRSQVADFVLHDFSSSEEGELNEWIAHVAKACQMMLDEPLERVKSQASLKDIEGLKGTVNPKETMSPKG